ncbi:Uncharacterised protein [Zhongshania aliphaticivorans]|uniref:GDYXXLXY domain-containing protein n=1 Tax=Zhongshania aliphaticivorans TaxID=1470434 RepID=A0A5S9PY81_9GAMM|nr:GDYXXLXY domain-containing protein [Zhongshania aliphaticivorans]CAA0092383.1 Uncharacterised protein [Zhongshania aliphaticivorans]CAA0109648.1 Uncharacterised protein [Zhongshania aliphaticivorans]
MRKALIIVLVLSQFAVLGYMAGEREWIHRNGDRIYLRTAPIDPRDPFRGDYVQLSYALNTIDAARYRSTLAASLPSSDAVVYAVLKRGAEGVYGLDYLSDRQPSSGTFLRGRVSREPNGGQIHVRYGIEQYFVEQGAGIAIEKKRGDRDSVQIPMEVEVALGRGGQSVLTGFRWAPIGIRLEQLTTVSDESDRGEARPPRSPKLLLTLKNVSNNVLLIADNALHCGFSLQAEGDTGRRYSMANNHCSPYVLQEADVITLAPGQAYRAELDMALPRWYVLEEGAAGSASLAVAAVNERFRIVYRPPVIPADTSVNEGVLWQGEIVSPTFNVRGVID